MFRNDIGITLVIQSDTSMEVKLLISFFVAVTHNCYFCDKKAYIHISLSLQQFMLRDKSTVFLINYHIGNLKLERNVLTEKSAMTCLSSGYLH